ncbi:glycosyl hydrolase [Nonomuraea sp. NBC_00507]|uniref:glycosyl hydrolase n=1 Tax=Nonomuraea sp. NBC_00507 TaxID=2976002 RepID=UPI002E1960A5
MRQGEPRADVAVFRQTGYTKTGIGAAWFTASGIPTGWTHQFVSEPLLDLARVTHGRLGRPRYKALFVEGDRFAANECTMTVAVARRLLEYAAEGLPIVLLGAWHQASLPGLGDPAELRALLADLLARPSVRVVAAQADVPQALAELGVRPDVRYATSSTLLHARRTTGEADYYYFCNGKHGENVKPPVAPIDHDVTLPRGGGVPYRMDSWSGRVEPIALYAEEADGIRLRVALQPGQATIVAVGRPGTGGRLPHAVATEADLVRYAGGRLVARVSRAGAYATTLAGGRVVTSVIGPVPEPVELSSWRLRVEDVRADGAYLELGEVTDTCRVRINGRRLDPVDQIVRVVDAGPYLRSGRNTVEVEVATPLGNRLRVADPAVYSGLARQPYGLLGPVRLVPYGEAALG